MASAIVTLRGLVAAAIETQREAAGFILNDFSVQESYLPINSVENLPTGGILWVIGCTGDGHLISRNYDYQKDCTIEFALQRPFSGNPTADPAVTTLLDKYIELTEELEVCVKNAAQGHDSFTFQRIEAMKDEHGNPYPFIGLHSASVFEAYFTAHFFTFLGLP